ncbi:MAG: hypothetical protein HC772_18025 [Leptolyngbyaceae cyanobacterium CRU_2_3]|nr:hypothetical protein [Leptolyngbyaceae cyanobacterium CRU_2_3]
MLNLPALLERYRPALAILWLTSFGLSLMFLGVAIAIPSSCPLKPQIATLSFRNPLMIRERLADSSDVQSHQSQVTRQPVVAGLKQSIGYVNAQTYAKQKEADEGAVRGWELYGLQGKVLQAKYNAHAEQVKAETSRLGFIGAGMDMLAAQQSVISSGIKWQTARVQNETARIGLKTAQLDLKGAIAEYPLHHQLLTNRLQELQLDCVAGLQKIIVKREPLSIAGMLRMPNACEFAFQLPSLFQIPMV